MPDKQKVKRLRVVHSKKTLESASLASQTSLLPKPDTKMSAEEGKSKSPDFEEVSKRNHKSVLKL